MKKVIFVLLFILPLLINSYSQTKQESIKELFHSMQQDSIMDKMFNSMVPSIMNQMQSQMSIDSTAKVHSNEMMNSIMQTAKEISKKLINEDMVVLYDKYFTQNEIKDFITFYKSPSGQKFIKVTPDIQKDLMMVMMQKYIPEMQKAVKDRIEEKMKSDRK
ncbi:MAG: DUF2059 domain-containing protein [Bacteroidales bacterium]|nr:DUF2059 domain-containing protein [Bacteroidales bacterium]MDD3906946.1 DUF2059 domain-containing protein [Bacteroidales bacterium]MDD4711801.1 DUF2059 domain-containing protein [Bacteroidales bacterium]